LSKLVATRPTSNNDAPGAKTNAVDIQKFMAKQNGFVAGTSIEYNPSYICTGTDNQNLATGFKIVQRFHSAEAIRVADGGRQHLGHLNKAHGRWRIFIFGNKKNQKKALLGYTSW
jgi:phenol 2-monooxygenase